jgi:hypothetical protein
MRSSSSRSQMGSGRVSTAPIQDAGRVVQELAPRVELLYGVTVWMVWMDGAGVTWFPDVAVR